MKTFFKKIPTTVLAVMLLGALSHPGLMASENTPGDAELLKVTRKLETGQAVKIVCLGDSITAVTLHTGNRMAWPELLDQGLRQLYPRANIKVLNAGVSGITTPGALKNVDKEVLEPKPALAIVMLGMNDNSSGEEKSMAAMEAIVTKIKTANIPLMVCLQNYASVVAPPFNDARSALLLKLQVPIVDCHSAFKLLFDEGKKTPGKWIDYQLLMSDGIHPNLEGQRLLTQTIVKRLTQKDLPLSAIPGTQPSIPLTLSKAKEGQSLVLTVFGLDDALVLKAFRKVFSRAKIKSTPRSVKALTWETVKKNEPAFWQQNGDDVLLVCFPEGETLPAQEYYADLSGFRRLLSQKREIVWVANSVLSNQPLTQPAAEREELMRRFASGMDVGFIQREAKDVRAPEEIIASWLLQQATLKPAPKHTR